MITEERKKYNRDYYLKHKETLLERQRIYRESNREILREKGREYVREILMLSRNMRKNIRRVD